MVLIGLTAAVTGGVAPINSMPMARRPFEAAANGEAPHHCLRGLVVLVYGTSRKVFSYTVSGDREALSPVPGT